jgi:hypothetical protein
MHKIHVLYAEKFASCLGLKCANTCRLYWYRGVTVLLPGWVIWKYGNCPCKFFSSLGSWLTLSGGEGCNSTADLHPKTISSIQLQCIHAARPHPADKTTSKPKAKYCMYICCAVLRIHDILGWIRIRIRGSMPLTNGSWIRILLFSSWTFKIQQKN